MAVHDERAVEATEGATAPRRVLVAHPSPDLYGSDLQMLSALDGLLEHGWSISLVLPTSGPLIDRVEQVGARRALDVRVLEFPVLRRALLNPIAFARFLVLLPVTLVRLVRLIRSCAPDVVYVNTVTIPWWVLAARLAGVPVVVHVREAEEGWPGVVRWLLAAPLLGASAVVTNSQASRRVLVASVARLAGRSSVIYNGIAGPGESASVEAAAEVAAAEVAAAGDAGVAAGVAAGDAVGAGVVGTGVVARLALVARLSPRKGVDVALEAVAVLRGQGRAVELDVCGTAYAGYEWFESQMRARAGEPDLVGSVRFHGYVNPTWPVLSGASVVLVPSRVEPFGNTAVEGLLAGRPVVASRVQGLAEILVDGETGLLVAPGEVGELAAAVARLLDDPRWAAELAEQGRQDALERFSVIRYRADMDELLATVAEPGTPRGAAPELVIDS